MTNEPPRFLTISQAAARLGIHQNTLRGWADRGIVAHVKLLSGYRRFDPDEIERVRQGMQVEATEEGKAACLDQTQASGSAVHHLPL